MFIDDAGKTVPPNKILYAAGLGLGGDDGHNEAPRKLVPERSRLTIHLS